MALVLTGDWVKTTACAGSYDKLRDKFDDTDSLVVQYRYLLDVAQKGGNLIWFANKVLHGEHLDKFYLSTIYDRNTAFRAIESAKKRGAEAYRTAYAAYMGGLRVQVTDHLWSAICAEYGE